MNYLYLDDLQEEYQALKDALADGSLDAEDDKRYHELVDFADECGIDPDSIYWGDCSPGIPADEFADYAEEFAKDVCPAFWEKDSRGDIITNTWPLNCIDWEQAANDLKHDYSLVTFEGNDYYIRSY